MENRFKVGDRVHHRSPSNKLGIGTVVVPGLRVKVQWDCNTGGPYDHLHTNLILYDNGLDTMLKVAFGE